MFPWTERHEHALQNSDDFSAAVDHLLAGRSLTGAAVREPAAFDWTGTQIKNLRRFCYDQRLKWRWAGFTMIEITDPLTSETFIVTGYCDLGRTLSFVFTSRITAIALRMPGGERVISEEEDAFDISWLADDLEFVGQRQAA